MKNRCIVRSDISVKVDIAKTAPNATEKPNIHAAKRSQFFRSIAWKYRINRIESYRRNRKILIFAKVLECKPFGQNIIKVTGGRVVLIHDT